MKIGISTACFYPELETEAAARTIKLSGAACAEVLLNTFYEYRPEFAKAIAPDICGLEVNSVRVRAESFEGQLFAPSRRVRGDGLYWLDQIMRSAGLLGAENYTFCGAGYSEKLDCTEDFDCLSGYIRGVIEFCARYGVNLRLVNSCGGVYRRPYLFGELKKRCPQLTGVLDLAAARRSGYPYTMYLKDMEGAISQVNITVEDLKANAELFKRLNGIGFDGAVIIDSERCADASDLKRLTEFLRDIAD